MVSPVVRARSTLLLYIRGQLVDGRLLLGDWADVWHRTFQEEAGRTGVVTQTVVCGYTPTGTTLGRIDRPKAPLADPEELDRALGAVVVEGIEPLTTPLLGALSSRGVHTAFITGAVRGREPALGHGVVKRFAPCSGTQAGRDVGRYLAGLGHRTATFLSVDHAEEWSRSRLAGLREVFHCSAHGASVLEATTTVDTDAVSASLDEGSTVADTLAAVVEWCTRRHSLRFTQVGEAIAATRYQIRAAITAREQRRQMASLFEEAVSHKHSTAWVCATDALAIQALQFLRDRKVDVPGTLPVVPFDDCRDSRVAQLTSYNPGYAAVAAMAVNYILSPRRKTERRWAHAPSGALIVRSSCAPPRHS